MYCNNCGSEIDERAVICPKCGVPVKKNALNDGEKTSKTNTMAIVGFILSFLISIAGLICCIIARKQCNETGEQGMGLATAGMIISIVSIVLSFIFILIYVIVIAAAAAML